MLGVSSDVKSFLISWLLAANRLASAAIAWFFQPVTSWLFGWPL